MTKADIVDRIYERVGGLSKKEAADVVDAVFDAMKDSLSRGDKLKVSGFGNFLVRDKAARVGRNPQTGEQITIAARRVLTFKPSQVLKTLLNEDVGSSASEPAEPGQDRAPGGDHLANAGAGD